MSEKLTCDCYPGCWGDHARNLNWPEIDIPSRLIRNKMETSDLFGASLDRPAAVRAILNEASGIHAYPAAGQYVLMENDKLRVADWTIADYLKERFREMVPYCDEHKLQFSGSCTAGCDDKCSCTLSVLECVHCTYCDNGETDREAVQQRCPHYGELMIVTGKHFTEAFF